MAQITLTRDASGWRDRFRRYRVLIDDEVVGSISRGETSNFNVATGTHVVRLKMDVAASPSVKVDVPNSGVHLVCGPNYRVWAALIALFRPKRWIYLSLEPISTLWDQAREN